ncbi:hypothetical protein HanHA300_Chr12g0443311 [Helianthus annuus]|nr:hypothetical protein HanHA300_Chr12g0443311 [Helianthus annuus]KAJ0505253.1 hypothetical protein HanHA89_Chr12g0468431 [Helianthus annuus]KAJ0674935.1 hypothetical protein HanLR1_Chr12g0445531 [Helianthus annuus]KAJ0678262.1 hypothetical protein HanOQP8_Chr12g0445901 [Helianthus annuus]
MFTQFGVNYLDSPWGLPFFTFSPQLFKIACLIPMVCSLHTRVVPTLDGR